MYVRSEVQVDTIGIVFGQLGNVDKGVMAKGISFCDMVQALDTSLVVMSEVVHSKGSAPS